MFGLNQHSKPHRLGVLALASSLVFLSGHAAADERSDTEQVRATTLALMQALIDNGLLSKEKADEIVRQAQKSGPVAAAPADSAADKSKPAVVRVPYVSETTKAEMRDQIKQDVLAQARTERWGEPGALPDWLSRVAVEADLRVRLQGDLFDKDNLAPDSSNGYATQTGSSALAGSSLGWSPDLSNTQHDRSRMTLRARLGVRSELGEGVSAGLRLTTGATSGPASTSQTLGNSLNKYTVVLDRAYVKFAGDSGMQGSAGRFSNPFFGSDLTWPDDINFDGVAVSFKPTVGDSGALFMTAGAFPLREFETSSKDKWLYGAQVGGAFVVAPKTSFRLGLAAYDFKGIEGRPETTVQPTGPSANVRPYLLTEYQVGVRQKGNTLIRVNQYDATGATVWGLASKFLPVNLSADLTFSQFNPFNIRLSADYVKNVGFKLDEIRTRSGLTNGNGQALPLASQTTAVQLKLVAGVDQIDRAGQWQGTLAFRRLERDAWVDAFTDTTWHLGGTNYQGWSLGGQMGVAPRTAVGLRWTSTRSLPDATIYTDQFNNTSTSLSNTPLKIDVLQLELNSRF